MRLLPELRIQRCLHNNLINTERLELHIFSDASEVGYGAVAYVTFSVDGKRSSRLIFSKGRVAPLKTVSLPRLELTAAVLAVRVWDIIRKSEMLIFDGVYFWCDSTIVLYYIRNEVSRYCTFVANRLTTIHDLSKVDQWRYVPSEHNPADLLSRGLVSRRSVDKWFSGPSFLLEPQSSWPINVSRNVSESEIELKRQHASINLTIHDTFWTPLWERYSDYASLVRTIAWLTRFKEYKVILMSNSNLRVSTGYLTVSEIERAERKLLAAVQESHYTEDVAHILKFNRVIHRSSLRKLNPIFFDGLLRVDSRIKSSDLSTDCRYPIIMPTKHHVTSLLVRKYHEQEGHAGIAQISAAIRQRFWITRGNSAIKGILRSCFHCKKLNATVGRQLMAPLPLVRITPGWFPFSDVGIDYFGPINVKRGRGLEKRYGCVITCLKCRAVHIEVAHSLTTESFMMVLSRFIGRRGFPKNIYSDNGTNLVGADREIKRALKEFDQLKLSRKLALKGIQWHFNPPYSSHRGGVWERLIRSIRRIMHSLLSEQHPNDESLQTIMVEAERILNSRPIVPVMSSDLSSLALTPNDLLLLRSNIILDYQSSLTDRYRSGWKQANYLAGVFWTRWSKEYLSTLLLRQKWISRGRNMRIGDIVLLKSDKLHRNDWPLGRVIDVKNDSDGAVRTVKIRTSKGDVLRDVRCLCFLEGDDRGDSPPETQQTMHNCGIDAHGNTTLLSSGRRALESAVHVGPRE